MIRFVVDDICNVEADVIVNAANAIGFMGGWLGKRKKFSGVAESIHFHTKGTVEKEAKKVVWREKPKSGEVYVTGAANLKAKYIFHAVTMFFPGTRSRIEIVNRCLDNIIRKAYELNVQTIAIPTLGAGTGMINKQKLATLYKSKLMQSSLTFVIVDPSGKFIDYF